MPADENPTVAMMEAAYRHHGLDARYLNCEVAAEALGDAVRGARAMGWLRSTVRSLTRSRCLTSTCLAQSATVIGAVNCVVLRDGRLIGENTDGQGSVGVILGFMILIHEFGHYAVAKLLGVRVEQFAIGFGKRLFGFRKGETDYRINVLPLGGYVKMSGENPMDERSGDPGEFMSHPRWHRFLIAIAGPAMNILFAVGLLTCVYMVHYEYPAVLDEPAIIGWVAAGHACGQSRDPVGDRIVRIDGIQNPTWEQVIPREALNPNQPLDVTIERGGKVLTKTIVPEAYGPNQMGSAGWAPKEPSFPITDLEPGMPAEKAGMKLGDEIIERGRASRSPASRP